MAHTGERLSAGHTLETEIEHFHRYYMARHFCRGQRVLDIASGEGYGSALLAQVAASVIGVDIDPAAVEHAAVSYVNGNLTFHQGSATEIPVEDGSIDVVVSFETLEHFSDHDRFMSEARRVLRPGGKLILSTPDRDIFSPPGKPISEYHVHELSRAEFKTLLSRYFSNFTLFSQRVLVCSAILRADGDPAHVPPLIFEGRGDSQIEMSDGLPRAPYLICVASDGNEDLVPGGLLIDTGGLAAIYRDHDALVQRIDRDRTIQVADLNHRHTEEVGTVRAEEREAGAARVAMLERRAAIRITALESALIRASSALAVGESRHPPSATRWVLAKAQRAAIRFPRATRSARAAAKLAYWTVTFQVARRTRARRQINADLAALASSNLFDRGWYLSKHPEVAHAGADPILHYYWTGAAAGYDPHPLFDGFWYLATYPEVARLGRNPLAHYIREGSAAGHDPHPLFDSAHYLSGRARPATTVLEHYLARTREDGEAFAVNAMFDGALYLAEHPAAAASGLDPLIHYVTAGATAGYAPHPLFDASWYAARYPDCTGYPADEGVRALAHFARIGLRDGSHPSKLLETCGVAVSSGMALGFPETALPGISIIVPAYSNLFETYRCLCSVLWRSGAVPYEVIVADDRPDAPIAPLLACFAGLRTHVNHINLGFLRSCNATAKLARGKYLVFLNNDTEVGANWLAPLVAIADGDAMVGMVGCKLLQSDGTIQEAGGILRDDGWGEPYGRGDDAARGEYNFVRDVDCVTGACFLVPRAHWNAVGGFDTAYAPAFYEEFDLAVTLRHAGLRVVYQPASEVTHHGSASYGAETRDHYSSINHAHFRRKWADYLTTRPSVRDTLFSARDARAYAGVALVIDDRVPEPDRNAGGLTLFQYLILLHDLGLKVAYCPEDLVAREPYAGRLQQRGIEIVHAPDTLAAWLSRNGRHVDHVWIARPSIAAAVIDELRLHTGAPILYYTHDLHYLREMRRFEIDGDWAARDESHRLKRQEFDIFARVDVVMSPSAEEAEIIRREVPTATVRVIPPYLFAASAEPPVSLSAATFMDRHDIVFVGGFDHPPNTDAAIWLIDEIFPLIRARVPSARLVIVGNRPPPSVTALAAADVEITGYVPDLAPYYAAARMSLSPLRYGAGVKGKVVESLQAGVPVVTTPIGGEGIGLRDGVEALIGSTASEIAECAIRLFEDAGLCARLTVAGKAVVRERFSVATATLATRELFEIG